MLPGQPHLCPEPKTHGLLSQHGEETTGGAHRPAPCTHAAQRPRNCRPFCCCPEVNGASLEPGRGSHRPSHVLRKRSLCKRGLVSRLTGPSVAQSLAFRGCVSVCVQGCPASAPDTLLRRKHTPAHRFRDTPRLPGVRPCECHSRGDSRPSPWPLTLQPRSQLAWSPPSWSVLSSRRLSSS